LNNDFFRNEPSLKVVSFLKIRYNSTGDTMVNYPNKKNRTTNSTFSSSNLGMSLEEDINQSNAYYLVHGIANVHKKPTPIQVVSVAYPARNKAKITEAYYKTPSTTDYNGVYKGYALDFEAKQTKNKTAFSLKNIHQHQIDHLCDVSNHGAIAFLIIRFSMFNETYLLYYEQLEAFIKNNTRASIPRAYFIKYAQLIPYSLTPPVDYLSMIDLSFNSRSTT
jgi:recombination protein U